MRIVCPCCQTDFPIEAGINDVDARAAVQRAFALTPIGKLLLGYEYRAFAFLRHFQSVNVIYIVIFCGRVKLNVPAYATFAAT